VQSNRGLVVSSAVHILRRQRASIVHSAGQDTLQTRITLLSGYVKIILSGSARAGVLDDKVLCQDGGTFFWHSLSCVGGTQVICRRTLRNGLSLQYRDRMV